MASRPKHPRRRRRQQPLRQTPAPKRTSTEPPVGWFAQQGIDAVCDGDALIIAGTRDKLSRILRIHNKNPHDFQIHSTTAAEVLTGIALGAAYCFDEQPTPDSSRPRKPLVCR